MGNQQTISPEDAIINLKMAKREFERASKKAEAESAIAHDKIKGFLEKGNIEIARIHAETEIRKRKESTNLLKMSDKLDATIRFLLPLF